MPPGGQSTCLLRFTSLIKKNFLANPQAPTGDLQVTCGLTREPITSDPGRYGHGFIFYSTHGFWPGCDPGDPCQALCQTMEKIPEYVKGNILPSVSLNLLEITSFITPPITSNPPHLLLTTEELFSKKSSMVENAVSVCVLLRLQVPKKEDTVIPVPSSFSFWGTL